MENQTEQGTTPETDLLLQRTASWNDVPFAAYPQGQPELTTVRMTIPPHSSLPWHTHDMPNVAYLLSGRLTVEERDTGRSATYRAGEAFAESVHNVHRGVTDSEPAEVIVTYTGTPGQRLSVPQEGDSLESKMKSTLPPLGNNGQDINNPPIMPFWEMRIAPGGGSTIEQSLLDGFIRQSVSGDAAAIWMRQFPGTVKAVWFNILPVGWVGEWHPSPALQWVVPLSGRWFIETQDRIRVEMGPGDIHWGADIAGSTGDDEIGHRSGQLGDVPCVQLMVQFHDTADRSVMAPED
jgi:quercetin dioxygenase-like cupin family protein